MKPVRAHRRNKTDGFEKHMLYPHIIQAKPKEKSLFSPAALMGAPVEYKSREQSNPEKGILNSSYNDE